MRKRKLSSESDGEIAADTLHCYVCGGVVSGVEVGASLNICSSCHGTRKGNSPPIPAKRSHTESPTDKEGDGERGGDDDSEYITLLCISMLIDQSTLLECISQSDVLSLSLVCKHTNQLCYEAICNGVTFDITESTLLEHYKIKHAVFRGVSMPTTALPATLLSIEFSDSFSGPLANLDVEITHIYLGRNFNQPVDYLPSTLTHLSIHCREYATGQNHGANFNQPIDHLPPTLTYLCIHSCFDHAVDHLPPSLTHFYLSSNKFNKPVDNLPDGLFALQINGSNFNQPMDNLPKELQELEICVFPHTGGFNQPIDNLPPGLKILIIGGQFDQPINNLPPTLEFLRLNGIFNKPIDNLPNSLRVLELSVMFNLPVDKLPANLVELQVGPSFNQPVANLPASLEKLLQMHLCDVAKETDGCAWYEGEETDEEIEEIRQDLEFDTDGLGEDFNQKIDNLPPKLEELETGSSFTQSADSLPYSLLTLKFGRKFNNLVDFLPANLQNLTFGLKFNQTVNSLPPKITHLTFGRNFNQKIDYLPQTITHLSMGRQFNHSVEHLPASLLHLSFRCKFNQSVDKLPLCLKTLELGYRFNQPVNNLPTTLNKLTFGYQFNQNVDKLPASLTFLQFRSVPQNVEILLLPRSLQELNFDMHGYVNVDDVSNWMNDMVKLPPLLGNLNMYVDFVPSMEHGDALKNGLKNIPSCCRMRLGNISVSP